MTYKLPAAKPDLSGNERKYLNQAIDEGFVSSKGRFIKEFEERFADYVGTKHAVACSSGTNGLILALRALGIKQGDEVIVPEFTMIATAWAVTIVGAKPVFVDCDDSLNINIGKIQEKITAKTRAIMPVHIYGRVANIEVIKKFGLPVIEDACEAHGASLNGKKTGSMGDMGVFSLFGNKIITAGEGGVVTTNNPNTYAKLIKLRSMYFDEGHSFHHLELAYNFRMTNLQGAVALAQLERIDEFLEKREQIRKWYDEYLQQFTVYRLEGSVLWYYDMLHPKRDEIRKALDSAGIETRLFFKPMSLQPMYFNNKYVDLKANQAAENGFYLPTFTQMAQTDVKKVVEIIAKVVKL